MQILCKPASCAKVVQNQKSPGILCKGCARIRAGRGLTQATLRPAESRRGRGQRAAGLACGASFVAGRVNTAAGIKTRRGRIVARPLACAVRGDGRTQRGDLKSGVFSVISLSMVDPRSLARSLASTLAPSRASSVRMIREIRAVAGLPGCSALLSEPDWIVDGWIAGKAKLRANDKKLIWLIHSLIFHPEHLSSLFHVSTFARFWCGPYQDRGGLKPRRAARADADRLRRRRAVPGRDRHATGAGEILGAPPVCAWSV